MSPRTVDVFYYGSYMNLEVLAGLGLRPERIAVARLDDFDIRIRPLANLVPAVGCRVHGIVAASTHDEIHRLYDHARDVLGGVYLPEAVVVHTADDPARPALVYVAPRMDAAPADPAYVERIVAAARGHGLPADYVRKLESFRE